MLTLQAVDIDYESHSFQLDPWPVYKEIRNSRPVYWSERHGSFIVTSHKGVRSVLTAADRFTVEHPFRTTRHLYGPTLIDLDGERHQRLRGLVGARFRGAAVRDLENAIIRPVVRQCLAQMSEGGSWELMSNFAELVPTNVILHVLGLPLADARYVYNRLRPIMRYLDYPRSGLDEAVEAIDELEQYVQGRCADPSVAGSNSLIGDLSREMANGRISAAEIVRHVLLFLSAGTETTIGTIGNVIACMLRHPETTARIMEGNQPVQRLIQETLRLEPPLHTTTRIAAQDAEVEGVFIPKGSFVQLVMASANRDESVYEDGDLWIPDRQVKHHLSFGAGAHHCIGLQLAHKELEIALEELLNAFRLSADPSRGIPVIAGRSFRCPPEAWVRLQPRNAAEGKREQC